MNTDYKKLSSEFLSQSIFRLEENTPRIEKCLELLTEEEAWQRPNSESNSIGNLILHLCGNIRQYIISSLGKNTDSRDRDLEFSQEGGLPKEELLRKLQIIIHESVQILSMIDAADLLEVKSVQGFELSGIGIIIHVVEHYSYHTGQIAFYTKQLKSQDLGFYEDMDLNVKNEG